MNESLLREAAEEAAVEYPITDDMESTQRTIRLVLREGFVKGFMRGLQ